ncbi:hypothetical protein LJ1_00314 [Lactobacillus johnsonii]|nr:hypothetical protein LJ1_00314 [Lactobacillus johnsonii]
MTFKELVKINVPRSILIFCLYILYAVAGSMGEYLFKDSLNNILKGMDIFFGLLFRLGWK